MARWRQRQALAASLLAGALLVVTLAASAHEFEHDLHRHDVPCAQHFFFDHSNTAIPVAVVAVAVTVPTSAYLAPAVGAPAYRTITPYSARAPPLRRSL